MSGTNNDLAYISATEVARLIKKGQITSVEVTQLAIDRANATQETLNAFITICEDQAIDAARSSDSAVSNGEKDVVNELIQFSPYFRGESFHAFDKIWA